MVYNVTAAPFNAVGDGSTDDTTAIQDACDAALAAGGGIVYFPVGRYKITNHIYAFGATSFVGEGRGSVILGYGTGNGHDRQLSIETGLPSFGGYTSTYPNAGSVPDHTATGALAVGEFSLTLNNVSGLAVGDRVYLWLGADPTDTTLPYYAAFNTIKTIASTTVTFRLPLPEAISDPNSAGKTHHCFKPIDIAENVVIENLAFERDLGSGNLGYNATAISFGRNVTYRSLFFTNMGYSSIMAVYGENYLIENIYTDRSIYDGGFSTSGGGFINGWTMRDLTIRNVVGQDIGNQMIGFEGQNRRLSLDGVNLSTSQSGAFPNMMSFTPMGTKGLVIRNVEMQAITVWSGIVGYTPDLIENITCWGKVGIASLAPVHGAVNFEGVIARRRKTFSNTFAIPTTAVTSQEIVLPSGWFANIRLYMSTKTGVTSLVIIANGTTGGDLIAQAVAGQMVEVTVTDPTPINLIGLQIAGSGGFNNNSANGYEKFLLLTTNGSTPPGAYGSIEIDYFPLGAGAGVDDLTKASVQFPGGVTATANETMPLFTGTWRATETTPAQITSDQNNYNPGGDGFYQRWSSNAGRNVTGLTFATPQVGGQIHIVINVGANNIILQDENGGSTAANRFVNSTGASISLAPLKAAQCTYDAASARWRVFKLN